MFARFEWIKVGCLGAECNGKPIKNRKQVAKHYRYRSIRYDNAADDVDDDDDGGGDDDDAGDAVDAAGSDDDDNNGLAASNQQQQ